MSKQRALELCDEADQELGYYNIDLLDVIKPLAKAVRELANDNNGRSPQDEIYLKNLIWVCIDQGIKQGANSTQIADSVMLVLNNSKDLVCRH